jgi:hypothetical protein
MVALMEEGFVHPRGADAPWWLIAPRAESGRILDWLSRSSADSGETTAESAAGVLEHQSIRRHRLWLAYYCDCRNVTFAAHSGCEPLTTVVRCNR